MRNLLFTISFCGTAYHGWQVQDNAVTVQQTVQDGIERILQKRENIVGCSRTDSGVHANMYCFNMRTESDMPCDRLVKALNAVIPEDVSVHSCREVPHGFHARYDCVGKEYKYLIWNSQTRNPFLTDRALHFPYELDTKLLDSQAAQFVGKYDFRSFCASGSSVESTVRNVTHASAERDGELVTLTFRADGFLYNMVRIMTGTLLDIANGRLEKDSIKNIILSEDRNAAGVTAPPHGLYLNKVNYDL
jgi:tRNA pseudouridine38-40 synthase